MPTAEYDWFIEAQESKEIPGQWFATAAKGATKAIPCAASGMMPIPEVRLNTGWHGSRKTAIEAVEVLIGQYEAGIP